MRLSPGVRSGVLAVLLFFAPSGAFAQDSATTAPAPVQLGRVGLTPLITFATGYETNVRYSPTDPQADTFVDIRPSLRAAFNLNRLLVDATVAVPYVHYADTPDLEHTGQDALLSLSLPFSRLTLKGSGSYLNTNRRVNLEINARVPEVQRVAGAGLSLRVTANMAVDVGLERQIHDYGQAEFDGVNLGETLSEHLQLVRVGVRRSITPLTDILGVFEARRDRFDGNQLRDADSQRLTFTMQSTALLTGRASVGYVSFSPLRRIVPPYTGVIASGDLRSLFFKTTLVAVQFSRDITYSYRELSPYYVATTATVSVTQAMAFGLVMRASAGADGADYQFVIPALSEDPDYTGRRYLVGVGRSLGPHLTLGGTFETFSRSSRTPGLNYTDRRTSAVLDLKF